VSRELPPAPPAPRASRRGFLAFLTTAFAARVALAGDDVAVWTLGIDGLAIVRLVSVSLPPLPTTRPIHVSRERPLVAHYAWVAGDPVVAWAERAKRDAHAEEKTGALMGLDAAGHAVRRYALTKLVPAKITVDPPGAQRQVTIELAFDTMTLA
jgi:hypothetical protein